MTDFRGATVGGIGRTFIDGVQIPIFDASVQGRVVQILDRATNLIRLRQQALRQLTSLRVALFHSMFENEKSKSRQYDTVCLGDVCSLIRDGTHKTPRYVAAGVPFITVKNIVSGSLDFNKTKFVTHKEHLELTKRAKPEKGDILVSKDGTIGVPCPVNGDEDFSIFVTVALLKPIHKIVDQIFLTSQISSASLQQQIRHRTKGIAIRHLHLEDFRKLRIVLPPLSAQKEFAGKILTIINHEKLLTKQATHFCAAFASLQHRAFRGEL